MRIVTGLVVLWAATCAHAAEITPIEEVERYVNIRSGPDAGADVVGRLNRGETLPSPGSRDGWYPVELPEGGVGYVHADWAVVVAADPVDAATTPGTVPASDDSADAVVADSSDPSTDTQAAAAGDEAPATDAPLSAPQVAEATIDEPAAQADLVDEDAEPRVEPTPAVAAPPPGSPIRGQRDFVVRFKTETTGTSSQIYDDGNVVGIGTTTPRQRLEVNGSIQINDQNSGVAGLMITQSSGDTGYMLHNRASTLTIGAGSVDRITIDRNGNVGFAVARPEHPLQLASGAYVSAGGVWTNSSSRRVKQDIEALDADVAIAAVLDLAPVSYRYRSDTEDTWLGFIAEDVPDLVATTDRTGVSSMDVVALLTRVVQEQERRIAILEKALADTRN